MDTYYQFVYGFMSGDEQLRCFTELNSKYMNLVCFAMFEHARKRLFENSRSRPFPIRSPTSNSIKLREVSLPPDTAKQGRTIELSLPRCEPSLALPNTTISSRVQPTPLVSTPTNGNRDITVSVATPTVPCHNPANTTNITPPPVTTPHGPLRATPTTTPLASPDVDELDITVPVAAPTVPRHDCTPPQSPIIILSYHEHPSTDGLITTTRISKEGEVERGEEEKEQERMEEKSEENRAGTELEGREQREEEGMQAGAVSKPPTPLPSSDPGHEQGSGERRARRRRRRCRRQSCRTPKATPASAVAPAFTPSARLPRTKLPAPSTTRNHSSGQGIRKRQTRRRRRSRRRHGRHLPYIITRAPSAAHIPAPVGTLPVDTRIVPAGAMHDDDIAVVTALAPPRPPPWSCQRARPFPLLVSAPRRPPVPVHAVHDDDAHVTVVTFPTSSHTHPHSDRLATIASNPIP